MTTDRTEYVAGLRQLADLLEQHDELPVPYEGSATSMTMYFLSQGRDAFVAAARVMPGRLDKKVRDTVYELRARLGGDDGLKVDLAAYRNDVCERVVTGTETVTKRVPDPNVTVPMVDVTETVEHVRWECKPLLSGGAS
jgi:hypothetical protein